MTFKEESYYIVMAKANDMVPGSREAYSQFEERVVLDRYQSQKLLPVSSSAERNKIMISD